MTVAAPELRRIGIFLAAAVAGLLATLALTILASLLIGQKLVVINSSTMEPALSDGDLLIERQRPPAEAEPGDIVTFSEPGTERSLTRRVKEVAPAGARLRFLTQADNAKTFERFSLPADGRIGVPTRKVPLVGNLAGPAGLVALVVLVLLAFAAVELSRRGRRGRP
jgi:signal peptidase I